MGRDDPELGFPHGGGTLWDDFTDDDSPDETLHDVVTRSPDFYQ